MNISEVMLAPFQDNPFFHRDITYIARLPKDSLENIIKIYLKSKYRRYYFLHIEEFVRVTNLSTMNSRRLLQLIDYFAYSLSPNFETEEIISALQGIYDKDDKETGNIQYFLEVLKKEETRKKLDILDKIDDQIGNVNPHFRAMSYNIEKRIIKDGKETIQILPIATLKIENSEDKETVVEFLNDDIEKVINIMTTIKKELEDS